MVDERKPLSKEDSEDLRVGRILEAGLKSEFWKVYAPILQKHIDAQTSQLIAGTPLPGEDGVTMVLRAEHNKGAILGLRLALTLASGIVQGQTIPLRQKLFGHSAIDDED